MLSAVVEELEGIKEGHLPGARGLPRGCEGGAGAAGVEMSMFAAAAAPWERARPGTGERPVDLGIWMRAS